MTPVALILNPVARAAARARRDVAAACAAAGLDPPEVWTTTVAEPGGPQAREAVRRGCARVVVAGGDGTVREVAGALGEETVLGVVPCGTANLAARSLGLPTRSPAAAARLAVTAEGRPVDLGRVRVCRRDGSTASLSFLVVVGVGHDAETLAGLSSAAKSRLGWMAYVTPGLRRLGHAGRPVRLRLDDDAAREESAWSVLAVNGGRLPLGAQLVPGARMDDGMLHVAVVQPRRRGDWARIAATGLGARRAEHPALRYRGGRSLLVELEPPGPVQVDGDVLPEAVSARIEILPASLRVARAGDLAGPRRIWG
ncbi:diacylglycerol/lipid kinase family protein [Serinicoccus kebangsaanensis]|uniref:diacylglycerol/lipid kinase family protein n=1 Tax=Serinicoccus kebangsaanensis TaxID=2602069 RepID=UPI00124E0168|nr:diacylglycerol kinase family protein [Serinicoccus kebangsaanensis]